MASARWRATSYEVEFGVEVGYVFDRGDRRRAGGKGGDSFAGDLYCSLEEKMVGKGVGNDEKKKTMGLMEAKKVSGVRLTSQQLVVATAASTYCQLLYSVSKAVQGSTRRYQHMGVFVPSLVPGGKIIKIIARMCRGFEFPWSRVVVSPRIACSSCSFSQSTPLLSNHLCREQHTSPTVLSRIHGARLCTHTAG